MNQSEISKLVSQLKIRVPPRLRKFRCPQGPEGRLDKMRKTVTALVKHERLELNYPRAFEARMYAERLISDAIRYGDCHKTTMEMADYWLMEKQLVHKLFKVLAPRYENYSVAVTRILKAPRPYPGPEHKKAILELKGNPYPSLLPDTISNKNLIHNILLNEAKKSYRAKKYAEIAAKINSVETISESEPNKVETPDAVEKVKDSNTDNSELKKD
ncbi:39S ribosomal protein L17, mitochondrial [Anthonomus grandis grandis]|uniref:39S ribosomal protein L17, mitochondrial n=1 Tax=Anthonomus grandis grandis TaxID=2921223 RepID=UPI00216631B2|nr:39S ribosomal protein L17, mitochondrial [Anthonomus grandis grandis]